MGKLSPWQTPEQRKSNTPVRATIIITLIATLLLVFIFIFLFHRPAN
jgi:hypothetical protein